MTPPELVDEVALRLGDPAGKRVSPKILYRLASRAQKRIADQALCYRKRQDILVVADQEEYLLDGGFLKEFSVVALTADGGQRTLQPMRPPRAVGTRPSAWGAQMFYYIDNRTSGTFGLQQAIFVWPAPASLTTGSEIPEDVYRIWHASSTPDLVEGASFLHIAAEFHEAVMLETVANAVLIPGSGAEKVAMHYRQLADRALIEARAVQSARMGDIGDPVPAGPWRT